MTPETKRPVFELSIYINPQQVSQRAEHALCEKYKKDAINVNYKAIKDCVSFSKNKKIIFLMSNSGYGVGEKDKFCTEDSPLNPISLYGKTKCDAEKEIIKLCLFSFSNRLWV